MEEVYSCGQDYLFDSFWMLTKSCSVEMCLVVWTLETESSAQSIDFVVIVKRGKGRVKSFYQRFVLLDFKPFPMIKLCSEYTRE